MADTKNEIEELLPRLVERFKPTRRVVLIWTEASGNYASARNRKYLIRMTEREHLHDWRGVLTHEFAHILTFSKSSRQYGAPYRYESHGQEFYESLLEVINELYEHPADYPWTKEYLKIYKRAYSDGLVSDVWKFAREQDAQGIERRQKRLVKVRQIRDNLSVGMPVNGIGPWKNVRGVITRIMRTRADVRWTLSDYSGETCIHKQTEPIDGLRPALPAEEKRAASPFSRRRRLAKGSR